MNKTVLITIFLVMISGMLLGCIEKTSQKIIYERVRDANRIKREQWKRKNDLRLLVST
jgi:hypothetical protein